jgi:hypothetical protein
MFTKPKPKSRLQIEIDQLVLALGAHEPNSDEFGTIVERLSKLHKIQDDNKSKTVSPDTALSVAANLLGILMIVHHEQLYPVTSKALSFIPKIR